MSAMHECGYFDLSARRQGDAVMLEVTGDLQLIAAQSLRRALRAICCEGESWGVEFIVDLRELHIESADAVAEITAAVQEMLGSPRTITVRCPPKILATQLETMAVGTEMAIPASETPSAADFAVGHLILEN